MASSPDPSSAPLVLGISGAMRYGSANEQALRIALERAEQLGARTQLVPGSRLAFQNFDEAVDADAKAGWFVDLVREAEGVVLCSPSYHGGMTGLLKNGLDYLELTAKDPRPYLRGLPVGCVATGDGWQGPNSTLLALRQTVHALQGWPTPLGVAQNLSDGGLGDAREPLRRMAEQVVEFVEMRRAARA